MKIDPGQWQNQDRYLSYLHGANNPSDQTSEAAKFTFGDLDQGHEFFLGLFRNASRVAQPSLKSNGETFHHDKQH
ncbi:MAG: hypothetical protein ACYCZL_06040 [Polaromonas sp.]